MLLPFPVYQPSPITVSCSMRTIDKLAATGILQRRKLPGPLRASGFLASDIDALILAGGASQSG